MSSYLGEYDLGLRTIGNVLVHGVRSDITVVLLNYSVISRRLEIITGADVSPVNCVMMVRGQLML